MSQLKVLLLVGARLFFVVFAANWLVGAAYLLAAETSEVVRERRLNADYDLLVRPSKQVEATYSLALEGPNLNAQEWILFGAVPPQMTRQKVQSHFDPRAERVDDLAGSPQKIFRARVPANVDSLKKSVSAKLIVQAQLYATKLVPKGKGIKSPRPEPLSTENRNHFLRDTTQLNFTHADFQAWKERHRLTRGETESQVDFARRVFLHIRSSLTYEYHNQMDRQVTFVCKHGKSDCGGLSNLWVATLRSEGIAARLVVGRWATSATPGEKVGEVAFYQQHAKAEFYADGIGWVPVDVASGILHDRSKQGLQFFGNDEGDFVTLHFDSDLKVDTVYFGEQTIVWLQGINFWVSGTGSFENLQSETDWQVETK